MLDLQHRPFIRRIWPGNRLCDHAIESRSFKSRKPVMRRSAVPRRRRQMQRCPRILEDSFQFSSTYSKRHLAQIAFLNLQQIEKHDGCRHLRGKHLHPATPQDECAGSTHRNPDRRRARSQSRHPERLAPAVVPAEVREVRESSGRAACRRGSGSIARRRCEKMIARNPSHFGSKLHTSALVGISSTRFASIGNIGDGKGSGISHSMRVVPGKGKTICSPARIHECPSRFVHAMGGI